jgi:chemotaxis protein CheC
MSGQMEVWDSLINGPRSHDALRTVMWRVACGLSNMVGRTISNGEPRVETVPLADVPVRAGGPEAEMVGIYLLIERGLRGQAIIILPLANALGLADLLMGNPPGTATYLGQVERSALAEVGNMALSYSLNAVAAHAGDIDDLLRPSPPAVMVDMLGAILNVVVTPVAVVRDDLVIIEAELNDARDTVQARFWVLPDPTIQGLVA